MSGNSGADFSLNPRLRPFENNNRRPRKRIK
jgi:hypothetical protein